MNTNFTKNPIVGTPLTPSVIKQIHTAVRRYMPIAGNGIRTSVTAGGTIISVIPAPARNVRGSASPDMSCWKIAYASRSSTTTDETTEVYPTLVNRYYSVGEVAAHMDEDVEIDLSDFILQGELQDDEEYTAADRPFICLKASARYGDSTAPEIVGYKTFDAVTAAQSDTAYVIKPLYQLSHYGAIVVDFRNMPGLQLAEVM